MKEAIILTKITLEYVPGINNLKQFYCSFKSYMSISIIKIKIKKLCLLCVCIQYSVELGSNERRVSRYVVQGTPFAGLNFKVCTPMHLARRNTHYKELYSWSWWIHRTVTVHQIIPQLGPIKGGLNSGLVFVSSSFKRAEFYSKLNSNNIFISLIPL